MPEANPFIEDARIVILHHSFYLGERKFWEVMSSELDGIALPLSEIAQGSPMTVVTIHPIALDHITFWVVFYLKPHRLPF